MTRPIAGNERERKEWPLPLLHLPDEYEREDHKSERVGRVPSQRRGREYTPELLTVEVRGKTAAAGVGRSETKEKRKMMKKMMKKKKKKKKKKKGSQW